MLAPLVNEKDINRGNINKILAIIEERYLNQEKKAAVEIKE